MEWWSTLEHDFFLYLKLLPKPEVLCTCFDLLFLLLFPVQENDGILLTLCFSCTFPSLYPAGYCVLILLLLFHWAFEGLLTSGLLCVWSGETVCQYLGTHGTYRIDRIPDSV